MSWRDIPAVVVTEFLNLVVLAVHPQPVVVGQVRSSKRTEADEAPGLGGLGRRRAHSGGDQDGGKEGVCESTHFGFPGSKRRSNGRYLFWR